MAFIASTEDGYAPDAGDTGCDASEQRLDPQDFHISLSELLRVIQFYNSQGYFACAAQNTEDGFCPGAP